MKMEVPPDSLQREEVSKNDLGRRSPWWGRRKEGTSDLKHSWSQFLVGFIHPVWWHPPDDGRLCTPVAALGEVRRRRSEEGRREVGHPSKQHQGGGRPVLILPHHQGGAQNSQKIMETEE